MEQNTFKRIDENRINADGLVWDNRADKAIRVKNLNSGHMVHSIKMDEVSYYPTSINKGNKNYIQIVEKEKVS
jgi:hypothetical protein